MNAANSTPTNDLYVFEDPESRLPLSARPEGNVILVRSQGGIPWRTWQPQPAKTTLEVLQSHYPGVTIDRPQLGLDQFHPRMYRRGKALAHELRDTTGLVSAQVSAARLHSMMARIFQTLEPINTNASAFGHELRLLLILACTEVEAAWRGILVANRYNLSQSSHYTTRDYVKLASPMRLREWRLRLVAYPSWGPIAPFEQWDSTKPTETLAWYAAYNATKHDRENSLHLASLRNIVDAMAALSVMVDAQFGNDTMDATGLPFTSLFVVDQHPRFVAKERYYVSSQEPRPTFHPVPCLL